MMVVYNALIAFWLQYTNMVTLIFKIVKIQQLVERSSHLLDAQILNFRM